MNKLGAILRADASKKLGLGHISRAIAMARTLERAGIKAHIYMRELDGDRGCADAKTRGHADIVRRLESEGEFLTILERASGGYLFFDLLEGASSSYDDLVKGLKPLFSRYRTICFDTFYERKLPFDLFVRPLFDGKAKDKNALIGLKYYVFPEELRVLTSAKKESAGVHRALISLGGSDPAGATPAVARELCGAFHKVRFIAVIGPGFREAERKELDALARQVANLELVVEPENLGRVYLDCDLAVTSGGLTKFETALFGIPTLIVANSPQEEELSIEFTAHGASAFLGRADRLDPAHVKEEFARLMQKDRAFAMSRKGREILDIHGGERVIEHIKRNLS